MRVRLSGVMVLAGLLASAIPASSGAVALETRPARYCHTLTKDDGRERDICIAADTFNADVCKAIEAYANTWHLPKGYLARLIWQESRFDPLAVSPAGAEGIAQFMPGTGRIRGVANAFDPAEALARSAEYLSFLNRRFGNLGLAAAAYNAGEGALERITGSGGYVPYETRDYVAIITGHPVERWLTGEVESVDYDLSKDKSFADACLQMAEARPMPRLLPQSAQWRPWGVLIWQDFSADKAQSIFDRVRTRHADLIGEEQLLLLKVRNPNFGRRLRYSAMIGRDSQKEAAALCAKLTAAGANCLVQRNSR